MSYKIKSVEVKKTFSMTQDIFVLQVVFSHNGTKPERGFEVGFIAWDDPGEIGEKLQRLGMEIQKEMSQ